MSAGSIILIWLNVRSLIWYIILLYCVVVQMANKQRAKEENGEMNNRVQIRQFKKKLPARAFLSKYSTFVVGNESLQIKDPDTLKVTGWLVDKVLNAYVRILQKENNMSTKDHIFVRRDFDTLKGNGWLVDKILNAYVTILQKENNMSTKDHIFCEETRTC